MLAQFLVIDKSFAKLNKGKTDILIINARQRIIFDVNAYVSEKSYDTLTRIVKKVAAIKESEMILRKVVKHNEDENLLQSEIDRIDNHILRIESEIAMDSDIDKVVSKVKNFNPSLN